MAFSGTRHLLGRVAVGVALAAVYTAAFMHGKTAWGIAVLLLLLVGAAEWARLGGFTWGQSLVYVLSVLLLAGLSILLVADKGSDKLYTAGLLFWLLLAPLALLGYRLRSEIFHAVVGALILICTWTAIIDLYGMNPYLLLFVVVLVASYDTSAMLIGQRFGRKRLAPKVSPNKTWEGVAGGVLVAHLAAFALWGYHDGTYPLIAVMCFTLIMLVLSILGDLFESVIKRSADVSDSSRVLLSHGGVLDRIDGMLPVLPFVALVDQSLGLS